MSDTEQIKEKVDIVEFIGEYLELKPAGTNYKGLCPFHREKTPSFMASRERQSWHCFGCSKGGDVFTFLQEIENIDFVEALRYLAKRTGVILTNSFAEVNSSQKNRIKEINEQAAYFFHNFLIKMPTAKLARDYLSLRSINEETISEWQIGYIPDQWDLLTNYLLKKGYAIDDLIAAGITIKKENSDHQAGKGFYDRFRGRIMFPIWDIYDNIVGFTGRILVEKENSGGKYVNTPQTIVYDKSKILYGLNKAKQSIKLQDKIVLVEGQMDVISCHQAGMKNVTASSGTALTDEQVILLKRYSKNISIAFDSDLAGQTAAKRGINLALGGGMNVKVILLPDNSGKDPDECIKKNKNIWFEAVEKAEDVMEWYFSSAFKNRDLANPKQKQIIADILLPEIILIPFALERDHWLRELSGRLQVEMEILREDIARHRQNRKTPKIDIYKEKHGTNSNNQASESVFEETKIKFDILLENILFLLFKFPNLIKELEQDLNKLVLSTSETSRLYQIVLRCYYNDNLLDLEKIRDKAMGEKMENYFSNLLLKGDVVFFSLTEEEAKNECKKILIRLKEEWLRAQRKKLQIAIEDAEKKQNKQRLSELISEYKNLDN